MAQVSCQTRTDGTWLRMAVHEVADAPAREAGIRTRYGELDPNPLELEITLVRAARVDVASDVGPDLQVCGLLHRHDDRGSARSQTAARRVREHRPRVLADVHRRGVEARRAGE